MYYTKLCWALRHLPLSNSAFETSSLREILQHICLIMVGSVLEGSTPAVFIASQPRGFESARYASKSREGGVESNEWESVTRVLSARGQVGKKILTLLNWYTFLRVATTAVYSRALPVGRATKRTIALSPYSAQAPITPQPFAVILDRGHYGLPVCCDSSLHLLLFPSSLPTTKFLTFLVPGSLLGSHICMPCLAVISITQRRFQTKPNTWCFKLKYANRPVV